MGLLDWDRGYARPKASISSSNRLEFINLPVPTPSFDPQKNVYRRFQSHFIAFLSKFLYDKTSLKNLVVSYEIKFFNKTSSPDVDRAYELTSTLLREMNALVTAHKGRLVIALAPTIVQVYDNIYWEKIKKDYHLSDDQYDILSPNKRLTAIANEQKIPIVDLTEDLRNEARSGKELYFYGDRHWNPEGHRVIANALRQFFSQYHLLDDRL